ncbi:hypothetical protein HDE_13194 [Halotydeus destructor]|nr:hypothetical protein HDE_13194 [Halotydeus destructor]
MTAARDTATSKNEVYFVRHQGKAGVHQCVANTKQCSKIVLSNKKRPMSLITATTSYSDNKIQTANFFVDNLGVEYQEAGHSFVSEVRVGPIKNGVHRNPTAIAFNRKISRKFDEFVIFFNEVFTVQTLNIKKSFDKKLPLVISRSQDYQLSKTWLGCPPELCFDSRLDYAYQDGDNIVLGRGLFSWRTSLKTKKIVNFKYGVSVQEVLAINGNLLTIRYGDILYNNISSNFKTIFRGAHSEDIDAAFKLRGEYILLSGKNAQVFKAKTSSSIPLFDFVRNDSISKLLPGAPSGGFEAASNMNDLWLYLFRNNFYYKYYPSRGLSMPNLIQGNLISCEDSYYKSSRASKKLNISTYQDLASYRSQFMEKPSVLLWTTKAKTTTRPSTSPATSPSTSLPTSPTTSLPTSQASTTKSITPTTTAKVQTNIVVLQITAVLLLMSLAIFILLLTTAIERYSKFSDARKSFRDKDNQPKIFGRSAQDMIDTI